MFTIPPSQDPEFFDENVPPQLFEPSYENRLRVVGRYLDDNELHSICLLEITDRMLVRACRGDDACPVVIEFTHHAIHSMIGDAVEARGEGESPHPATGLLPTGYEDFLRAVGFELDERVAEDIAIVEASSFIVVSGSEPQFESAGYRPFSDALGKDDVLQALGEAVDRRGAYETVRYYVPFSLRGQT